MKNLTIWKFDLNIADCQQVVMPIGAKILTVQEQHGSLVLWAIVDPTAEDIAREIVMYGTGHAVPDNPGQYIGTVQQADGALVWHFFEPEFPFCEPEVE